jgi:hypothetical protein
MLPTTGKIGYANDEGAIVLRAWTGIWF